MFFEGDIVQHGALPEQASVQTVAPAKHEVLSNMGL